MLQIHRCGICVQSNNVIRNKKDIMVKQELVTVKELLKSQDCSKACDVKDGLRNKRVNNKTNFIALTHGSSFTNFQVVIELDTVN